MAKLKDYQPEFFGVILALLLINVWYLSGVAIENKVLPKDYDFILQGLVTLVAAFGGAYFAFYLRENQDRNIVIEKNISAINTALFTLARQESAIDGIWKSICHLEKNKKRTRKLRVIGVADYKSIKLNIDSLSYLISEGHKNLLFELALTQDRFELTTGVLELRNSIHLHEFQPAIFKLGVKSIGEITEEELIEMVGGYIYGNLNSATDNLYETVSKCKESLSTIRDDVYSTAITLFPKSRIVYFKFKGANE